MDVKMWMPSAAALIGTYHNKLLKKMERWQRGGICFLQDVHIYEGKYVNKEEIKKLKAI